jgi:hypothetical protein
MTLSRFVAILSLLAAAATAVAGFLGGIRPQFAAIALGIAAAINAFTERVQGGAGKST